MAAVNIHGTGSYSDIVEIIAAQEPNQPSAAIVTINGLYIKINWTPPDANNAAISSYRVLLKQSDDSFIENLALCDGSSRSDPDTFGT